MVAHLNGVQVVAGSNPAGPTNFIKGFPASPEHSDITDALLMPWKRGASRVRWDCKTSAGETIFKAWVQTEFEHPDIDGFRVHLIRGHYVHVVPGHAERRGEVASDYWGL